MIHDKIIDKVITVSVVLFIFVFMLSTMKADRETETIDLNDVCSVVNHVSGEYDEFSCTDGDKEIQVIIHRK